MRGVDVINNNKVISIDKYKSVKPKQPKDVTENMLDMFGISFEKEEFFSELRKEKRKEKGIDGTGE